MTTINSLVSGCLVAFVSLIYWELKAKAARTRTQALRDEVRQIPDRTVKKANDSRSES